MSDPAPDPYPWLPLADLLAGFGMAEDDTKVPQLERARRAAAHYVQRLRPDLDGEDGYAPTDDVVQGAVMWAARIWARRSSPTGLVSFGEFGAVNTPSFDADAERLLGIGRYARPAIG